MKKTISSLALLVSFSTLFCCFLPALFVTLGFGAVFAGLIGNFPQLIWLSEHKPLVFGTAALLISLAGYLQYRARRLPCPLDPEVADACRTTRRGSAWVFFVSVVMFSTGAFFAFLLPWLSR